MALHEKSILCFPATPTPHLPPLPPPLPKKKDRSRFSVRPRERRLCWRRVRTTTSGLSPGETFILQFWDGLLGGTSQPGCQSVCASPLPPPPPSPLGTPVCATAGTRSCALLGDTSGKSVVPRSSVIIIILFFLPGNHRFFGLQPFQRARLQRDPAKHAERPFAHPSYRIRPIISTIASYDFFLYINII